jgi:3-oxoacyl-[acyl-carrier protein] reductase
LTAHWRVRPTSLRGRTALILGGSRNLGRACALHFAQREANIAIAARTSDQAATVAAECEAYGAPTLVACGDIGEPSDVDRIAAAVESKFDAVDIYVHCVAVRRHESYTDVSATVWDEVIRISLSSAFYLAHRIVPGMQQRGWGRVIHVVGSSSFTGLRDRIHHVAAKAGLHGLTKALALEVATDGVTVNTIAAGAFKTIRDTRAYPDWDDDDQGALSPTGRLGHPDELAAACGFLASDDAAYITGQVLHINGGRFMW